MCKQKNLPPSDRIGDVAGVPRNRDAKDEDKKWKRFKSFFRRKAKKGVKLGEAYAAAEVSKKQSDARKNLEEAAKLAAEKDKIKTEENLQKQKVVQEFNKAVDDIYADDGLPESAKKLKLAKLMENNPEIIKQIDKINTIVDKLSYTKGMVFEVQQEQKALVEGDESLGEDAVSEGD